MIKTKLVPLKSVLKDVYFLMTEDSITEDLVMEFAIRGMEHLAVAQTYEKAVCIIPIINNQGSYPNGMYGVHSVMGNILHDDSKTKWVSTSNATMVVNEVDKTFEVVQEGETTILYKLLDFRSVSFSQPGWFYLSLSNNTFDKSIVCADSVNLSTQCNHWFLPDNANNRFITSFDYGYIAVAYYRFPQDEKGQFLIPDHPLVHEALESYVLSKLYQRLWHSSTQGAQQKYYHYLEKWQQLAAAATGELAMLSLPAYVGMTRDNTFFKDYSPNKIYGGWGRERTNFSSF
jgi:hypothetical protein